MGITAPQTYLHDVPAESRDIAEEENDENTCGTTESCECEAAASLLVLICHCVLLCLG